jgi:hypothetical protein
VLKFVAANPGTDAEIVAVRVGLPKGKAPLDAVAYGPDQHRLAISERRRVG